MRKKWTYVAIVSMMLGVAPVFTGCVDTDEPAGLEQLRGAKAELLRAQAAVQQANAAIQQAKVAYVEACTREKNAIALQQEMEAERKRLQNEYQQAVNDQKRAEVEQEIADIEADMAEAALEHEAEMLNKQAALEIAKRNYDLVMQQIAIAEAIGSDVWGKTLTQLKEEVTNAYDALYASENGQQSLEDQLYYASKDLYTALQNKKAGYDTYPDGSVGKITDKEYWPATLEAIKGQKEVKLQIAQEALESLQAAAELPVEDTDWRNQVDAMGEEIDALVAEREQKQLEVQEAEAAPEYINAWQAAYGVFNVEPNKIGDTETEVKDWISQNPNQEPSKNGTMQTRDEAKKALNKAKRNTDIDIAAYSLPESITGVSDVVMEALGFPQNGEEQNKAYFSYGEGTYNWLDDQNQPADSADIPHGIELHIAGTYDAWLTPLAEAVIPANEVAQAQAKLAAAQKTADASKADYEKAVANWQTVLDITSKQTDYTAIDKTGLQSAVDAYKNAYTRLTNVVAEWNAALQTAYDDAKAKAEADLEAAEIANALNDAEVIAAFGNASAATNVLNGWTAAPEKNEATLTNLLNLYCTAVGNQTKAQVITAVQNAITAYVNEVTSSRDWIAAHEDDIENAAKKGVTDYQTADAAKGDKGYSASNGLVQSAVTGVQNAYDNSDPKKVDLVSAVADFAESAKGFAQTTTAALNAATMVQATGASSVDTRWIAQDKNFEETGVYTYKVLNSNIEDKEVSDATAVKFNPNWENVAVNNDMVVVTVKDKSGNTVDNYRGNDLNALEYRSWLAFGLVDRYVAPEDYEVLAIQSNTSNGNVVESKAEIYWDDVADVEKQQAIIDAQDDLKELQAALTDGKKAFLDQIAKDYTDNFGELQADYTEALAAHEKAVANLSDVREKLFGELDAEIDRLTAEIKANRDVYQKLKQLAWKYLNITWPEDSTNPDAPYTKPNDEYDPETFATELQEAIAYQQVLVAEAQQAVQEAQVNLDQATSGEYDGVHYFQFKLDQIQREWDRAYAEYEKAMANLEKGMAVIAEQAGSEQPAE